MDTMQDRGDRVGGAAVRALQRLAWPVLALLGGCGPTQFEAQTVIPPPLITQIPVVVGVHMPAEFREAVHREERDGGDIRDRGRQGADRRLPAADDRHVHAGRAGRVDRGRRHDRPGDPRRARAGARGVLLRHAARTRARRCTR